MHMYIPKRRCAHILCHGSYCAGYWLQNHDNTAVQGIGPFVRGDASNAETQAVISRFSSGSMRPTRVFEVVCQISSSGTFLRLQTIPSMAHRLPRRQSLENGITHLQDVQGSLQVPNRTFIHVYCIPLQFCWGSHFHEM